MDNNIIDPIRPPPPELEVTPSELAHIKANVCDHCVVCLPGAYVRAVPGLTPNVSGGYYTDRDDPRVSDEATLWVGRLQELGSLMGRFKKSLQSEDAVTDSATEDTGTRNLETGSSSKRVGDGVAALAFLAQLDNGGTNDCLPVAKKDDGVSFSPKPAVVFVAGSSGVAGDTLRYLRMLASEGHLVLCPDDFTGWPARLRHRTPTSITRWVVSQKETDDERVSKASSGNEETPSSGDEKNDESSDYWSLDLVYTQHEIPTGELVYESCAEQYTSSDRLAMVYDTTLAVKHLALTQLLLDLPKPIAKRGIFLAGNSEGAIVLGMMDDSMLETSGVSGAARVNGASSRAVSKPASLFSGFLSGISGLSFGGQTEPWEAKLLGRINIAYSLEPNYFTYRTIKKGSEGTKIEGTGDDTLGEPPAVSSSSRSASPAMMGHKPHPPRGLFGSRWRVDVPTLCVNGSADQFFGRRDSVSERVVHKSSDELIKQGDRPSITGDAGQRIAELGMRCAFVAQMEGAKHAMCVSHDAALRVTLRAFLADPTQCVFIPEVWRLETEQSGVERWDRTMLWHSVVTPGACSFAAIAATEIRHSQKRLVAHDKPARGRRAGATLVTRVDSDKKTDPEKIEEVEEALAVSSSKEVLTRSSSRTDDNSASSSQDVSLHGSRSFLDLTSSLAKKVRPWAFPKSRTTVCPYSTDTFFYLS